LVNSELSKFQDSNIQKPNYIPHIAQKSPYVRLIPHLKHISWLVLCSKEIKLYSYATLNAMALLCIIQSTRWNMPPIRLHSRFWGKIEAL